MLFYVFLLFCVIVTPVFSGSCDNDTPKSNVHKLKKDLLCNYDTTIRPVIHDGNRTVVNFKLVLKYFDYNDRMNTMTVHSWMPINWNDEHLKWDPNNYNGLKSIHISSTSIWVPDIALFNS